MDQSGQPPKRGTQPLSKLKGRSDSFVSSGAQLPPQHGTRPLQMPPPASLQIIVPQKLEEAGKIVTYVRHLVALFEGPVTLLRYAVYLTMPPPPPPEPVEPLPAEPAPDTDWASSPDLALAEPAPLEESVDPPAPSIPPEFERLNPAQRELAERCAEVIAQDPRVKQRAQVTLTQYDDAAEALRTAMAMLDDIYQCSYEEAWDRLGELGIERLKGKAYPISGFYENFKNDPALNHIFPAPNPANNPTAPLGGGGPKTRPLTQPLQAPVVHPVQQAPAPESGGLLGKLKGLFGK
jgi:hypothetical protein